MTPLRGTILLASLATIGAVLGGLAGATIGFIAPGYYRVIFEDGLMPAVDPIQVGAGLGAGQGTGAGLVLGVLLVALLAWQSVRAENSASGANAPASWETTRPGVMMAVKRFASGGVLLLVGIVSFVAGAVVGQTDIYNRRAADETRAIAKRLEEEVHTGRFEEIAYGRTSHGHAMLSGRVDERADRDMLIEELRDLFGTEMAIEMTRGVKVVHASSSGK